MNTSAYTSDSKNKANQFLITLPRWTRISDYKYWVDQNLPPHSFVAICAEAHEDGGNHHHIVLHSKTPVTKLQLLSRFLKLFPEDYKRIDVRHIRRDTINHCLDYIRKEDPDVWTSGEIPKGGRPKKIPEIDYAVTALNDMVFDSKDRNWKRLQSILTERENKYWEIFEKWALDTCCTKVDRAIRSHVEWFHTTVDYENWEIHETMSQIFK